MGLEIKAMKHRIVLLWLTMASISLASQAFASGNHESGEKVFKRVCSACHTVEAGKNRVGPSLAGVIGRKAASVDGFKYSAAMKGSAIVWTDDKIEAYLTDPKALVPGGSMVFAGLKNGQERADLIAYLKKEGK